MPAQPWYRLLGEEEEEIEVGLHESFGVKILLLMLNVGVFKQKNKLHVFGEAVLCVPNNNKIPNSLIFT